jgi:hypothetical protein
MLLQIPNQVFPQGFKRLFYQSAKLVEGKEVTVLLRKPNLTCVPTATLSELGNGLYCLKYNFDEIGDYVGTFFEDGEPTGSAIFRVSLG